MNLFELLASGDFDWDNENHRAAYLRTWVKAGNRLFLQQPEEPVA